MSSHKAQVDALFAEWDREESPGCAVAVIQDGRIIYSRGYGTGSLEYGSPLTAGSVFDIASTSKQFTAFCAALLARQGALDLDAEIQSYLPEMPRYEQALTARQLIHHTSGLRDYLALMDLAGSPFENVYTDGEILELIARQQGLNNRPGEAFLYSNSGYFLLGEIIKRVSGMPLRAFADTYIFKPLGMHNTHFHDDFREIVPRRAVGYAPREESGWRIDMSLFDLVGDGGIYTTVSDLALWDANFYDNALGGGQELIEEITAPGRLNNGASLSYAFGLFVSSYRGLKMISHGGSWMGYRAEMMRFPEQRFSVICLANLDRINPSRLARRIADVYLADVLQPSDVSYQPPAAGRRLSNGLKDKAGFYRSADGRTIWELSAAGGQLTAEVYGEHFRLAATGPDHFMAVGAPYDIRVTFAEEGRRLRVEIEDELPELLHKLPPYTLDPARGATELAERLAEYAGEFDSREAGVTIKFWAEDGALHFSRRNTPPERLRPAADGLFKGGEWVFEFGREAAGRVTAVDVSGFGLRALRFTRQQGPAYGSA